MIGLLEFIARIDVALYVLIGIGVLLALNEARKARRQQHMTIYALEREAARNRGRHALRRVAILMALVLVVYIMANIITPNVTMTVEEPTPTPAVFVTPEPTATEIILLFPTITPTLNLGTGDTVETGDIDGCEVIGTTITSPAPGETVSGQVAVEGEANIIAFLQYRFEVNGPSTQGEWVVVGTYNTARTGSLGSWDSTSLIPGEYQFRLVVFRTDGSYLAPCQIPVTVERGTS